MKHLIFSVLCLVMLPYVVFAGNKRPVATDDIAEFAEDQHFNLDVLLNDFDPEGSLNRTSLQILSQPTHCKAYLKGNGIIAFEPNADWAGEDFCVYSIADSKGKKSKAIVRILVSPVNDRPVLIDEELVIRAHSWSILDILANDSDHRDEQFGHGGLNEASAKIIIGPSNGLADADPITGEIRYKAEAGFTGKDKIYYTVADFEGATDTASLTIIVRMDNLPPELGDDIITGKGNEGVLIPILQNDTDPDGELDKSSLAIETLPAYGYVVVQESQILYSPNPGWCGEDEFTYTVCDMEGACSQAEVKVEITCLMPIAHEDEVFTQKGNPVTIHILVNDEPGTGAFLPSTITFPQSPLHGNVSVNENNGALTYSPIDQWCEDDQFTYQVCDQNGFCTSAAVEITGLCYVFTVSNDAAVTEQEVDISIAVLANDHNSANAATIQIVEAPINGTASRMASGKIMYFPPDGFMGEDCFTYRVYDFSGLVNATAEVCVSVLPGAIKIPEVFTPNGDGINDELLIEDLELFRNCKISVYDREKNLVFEQRSYDNNWTGIDAEGKPLPEGTYYIILIKDVFDLTAKSVLGFTTIQR